MDAFRCETVSVAGTVTLDQCMSLEFAQVVAQLVQTVSSLGEMEGCEDGLVDLLGGPTADVSAGVQKNLEQTDDAHVMDFDPGYRTEPMVMGSAMRCSNGKSTWTLSHCAW